jgi:uncharacterized protein (TIGR03067 family)
MIIDFDELARLAWLQFGQVTLSIGVIALAVRLVGRKRPHLCYALWMIVIVKCLTPPVLSSPTGIFCWAQPCAIVTGVVPDPPRPRESDSSTTIAISRRPETSPRASQQLQLARWQRRERRALDLALFSWLGGMVISAGIVSVMHIACRWVIRSSGHAGDANLSATVSELARRLGLRRPLRVWVTARPFGPAVFGLIQPTLVLSKPLLGALAPDQIEPILAHELIHIRRGDIAAGFVQTLAQVVWWFHPCVWWANRAAVRQREQCCDLESVASLGCAPADYARGLLRILELRQQLRPLLTLPGVRPLDLTRNRLEQIMASGARTPARTTRGQWLILTAVAIVMVPGASLPAQPRQPVVTDEAGSSVLDRYDVSNPQPGTPSMNMELEKLQGTWRMVSLEVDGKPIPGGAVTGARMVVEGNRFTTSGMGATYSGTLKIGPDQTPKTLDLEFEEGPEQGNTSLAIYEVESNSWKICLTLTGNTRPTAFATAPGSGCALELLEREVDAELRDPLPKEIDTPAVKAREQGSSTAGAQAGEKDLDQLQGEWTAVSLVLSGQALPDDFLRGSTRLVKGNETTVTIGGQVMVKATFTIDPSRVPRAIDYTLAAGPDAGKMQRGIYEFDGEVVRICFSSPGTARPTEFGSNPGDGRTFGVWKKTRKK